MKVIYAKVAEFLTNIVSIEFLTYQTLSQAIDFYDEGNDCLGVEGELQKAIDLYNKAIHLNP